MTSLPLGGSRSSLSLYIIRSAAVITAWSELPLSGKLAAPTLTLSRTIFTSTSSVVANTTLRTRCATSSAAALSALTSNTMNSSPPKRLGDELHGAVARLVAVSVVERFQVLDIDHQDGVRALGAARDLVLLLRETRECAHVVDRGQLVTIGQGADPLLRRVDVLDQQRRAERDEQKRRQHADRCHREIGRQPFDAS